MSYAFSSLDELGDTYGFRKIRKALGVDAFGVNAIVYPPRYEGPEHYHDTQDELYFVTGAHPRRCRGREPRARARRPLPRVGDDPPPNLERRR